MWKLPGTVPPGHWVVPLPSDLRVWLSIGLSKPATGSGWLFQLRPGPVPPTQSTEMASRPWSHEFQADHTSSIFSVEFRILKLGCRSLMSNRKKVRIFPMQDDQSL